MEFMPKLTFAHLFNHRDYPNHSTMKKSLRL